MINRNEYAARSVHKDNKMKLVYWHENERQSSVHNLQAYIGY